MPDQNGYIKPYTEEDLARFRQAQEMWKQVDDCSKPAPHTVEESIALANRIEMARAQGRLNLPPQSSKNI